MGHVVANKLKHSSSSLNVNMAHFDEATHTYSVGDLKLTSVTTLLSTWFKKFNPDETLKSMKAKPTWPQSKYFGMTDNEIKTMWMKDGALASKQGTAFHLEIETYLKTGQRSADSVEMDQFLRFAELEKMELVAMEHRVIDMDWRMAGTIDCVAQKDGKWILYDWKRCKDITTSYGYAIQEGLTHIPSSNFWKYSLQLNMYRALLEKSGQLVGGMFIVCFHPDHLDFQKYEVERMDIEKVLNTRLEKDLC